MPIFTDPDRDSDARCCAAMSGHPYDYVQTAANEPHKPPEASITPSVNNPVGILVDKHNAVGVTAPLRNLCWQVSARPAGVVTSRKQGCSVFAIPFQTEGGRTA